MGINLEKKRVHCFKCGLEVNPIGLLMQMERFDTYAQAAEMLRVQEEYEFYESQTRIAHEVKPVELPEGFHLINMGDGAHGVAARHYMKKRGFNITRLAMKGVGYCDKGPYAGYIIFPFYRKGKLVYFQGRLYMGSGTKMKNPPEEEFGIGKANLIYNQDALYIYDKVYLVESITNAETIGDNAIAIQGKKISEWQLGQLLLSPCSKVIILLDPDAWAEAIDLSLKMVNYKRVKLVGLPVEKDVNDLGRRETMRYVKKTRYQTYMQLFKLRVNVKGPIITHHTKPAYKIDRRGV